MPKSITLDGRRVRLPDALPQGQIKWLIARLHVSLEDAEVRAEIAQRAAGNPDWTPALIKAAQDFAVYCHRKNQTLYTKVMS